MKCRDKFCEPERGDEGCSAFCVNVGAFDALDFVWLKVWDDCPLMAAEERRVSAEQHEWDQYEAWIETIVTP